MAVEPEINEFVILAIIAVSAVQSLQRHLVFSMTINDNAVLFNTGNDIFHVIVWLRVNLSVSLWC